MNLDQSAKNELLQLNIDCVRSLRRYIEEANQTCAPLAQVEGFPIPAPQRIEMIDQRESENRASARYQNACKRLFDAAKWGDS
jgi:hypothetical protein